ncbi:MAG TPA: hypothetical protein ENL09_04985 [Bacteroidetes bacterium]|nr:hypothetical protein [Bacteroidota bacterium]
MKYFHDSFDLEEKLFETFKRNETYFIRLNPLCHPPIFYFEHTASFLSNKLILVKISEQRIDSKLESMFAFGVDEMSWDDVNEVHYDWTLLDEIKNYSNDIRKTIGRLVKQLQLSLPTGREDNF